LVFAPSSLILTNYYLPLSEALGAQGGSMQSADAAREKFNEKLRKLRKVSFSIFETKFL